MYAPIENGHDHSIREAVFQIGLSEPLSLDDIRRIGVFGRDTWTATLPRYEEFDVSLPVQIPLGSPIGSPTLSFTKGVSFQRFKDDGTLAWRVIAQDKLIAVNCLDYPGWDNVWPTVRGYLSGAAQQVGTEHPRTVVSATLQYINAFSWNGGHPIERALLLRRDADRIPEQFWKQKSDTWHLHQGWFDEIDEPIPGRILSRDHLTAQSEGSPPVLLTLVDLLARYDFRERQAETSLFFSERGPADGVFGDLRRRTRAALRSYLNDNVLDRIHASPL